MVQRLSCEDVLLSTLTDSSLMVEHYASEDLMFAFATHPKGRNSSQQTNDRSGDGGDDEQQDHHSDRTVLVLVIKGRADEAIPRDGFCKVARFFKLRRLPPWNTFSLANFATHASLMVPRVIALANLKPAASLIHRCLNTDCMERLDFGVGGERIHLAVEGSTGGTTLGLHLAADVINGGKRVLWASVEMPDPARFSQLFQHLSLVESSRFHAMNFGGKFDRAIDALLEAANSLPSVGLIVMDDWCPSSGRIPAERLNHIERVAAECPATATVLLISKGSVDASGSSEDPIVARSADAMARKGYQIWRLWRGTNGAKRVLVRGESPTDVVIEDSGFVA